MQRSIFVDWEEDFDGDRRRRRLADKTNMKRYPESSWNRCYIDDVHVDCETGEPIPFMNLWLLTGIIGGTVALTLIILYWMATAKCEKKFKFARICKSCKKERNAKCCGRHVHSSDSN